MSAYATLRAESWRNDLSPARMTALNHFQPVSVSEALGAAYGQKQPFEYGYSSDEPESRTVLMEAVRLVGPRIPNSQKARLQIRPIPLSWPHRPHT